MKNFSSMLIMFSWQQKYSSNFRDSIVLFSPDSCRRYPTDHRLMKREEKVILAKRVEAYGKTETDNIGQSLLPSGEDAKKGSPGNKVSKF